VILYYVIREFLENEEVAMTKDTPLIPTGFVDSFSLVFLLVFLANKFKIKIPPSKVIPEIFDVVNNIAALVNQFCG
jgi:acyl carrier protein